MKYSRPIHRSLVVLAVLLVLLTTFLLGMYAQGKLHPSTTAYISLPSDEKEAEGTLITFLTSLHEKEYTEAASVYGGDYMQLRRWNPTVDPTDVATLWKYGCEVNGLNCLEIRNAIFASQPDAYTFLFRVWFSNPDKISEFMLPDGTTSFLYTIKKQAEGGYLVETMPIYTP